MQKSLFSRLLWFVALWAVSVLALGVVGSIIKFLMHLAGMRSS